MATRKNRIPIQDDLAAEVLFASDRACCICWKPNSYRHIHHIDENPANNTFANLAVVCEECHTEIHTHRNFARGLPPEVVTKFRDRWLQEVKTRRAQSGTQATSVAVRSPRRTMSTEQAQRHAERLRALYEIFLNGVRGIQAVADEMARLGGNETLDQRAERLAPRLKEAMDNVQSTLPKLRVEPGSQEVCELYEDLRSDFDALMRAIKTGYDAHGAGDKGFWAHFSATMDLMVVRQEHNRLIRRASDLQAAVHAHIRSVDLYT